jgi:tetratricopeptide (TPR) repeat protein
MFRGEYNLALDLLESAISLGRETNHLIWYAYLLWLGHTYFLRGEYDRGLQSLQKCHDLFSRSGNDWGIAFALDKMAMAADALEDHVQAMRYHREALTIFERTDNRAGKGYCLSRMSMSTYFLEEYRESVKFGQEGYAIFSEIGHRWGMGVSKCRLGFAFLGTGNPDLAREQFMKALQQSQQDRMLPLSLYALAGLASIYSIAGDQQVAMAIFHYVQRHPRTPSAYLEQAGRWIRDLHASSQPALVDPIFSETDPVDKVVDFLLNHPK